MTESNEFSPLHEKAGAGLLIELKHMTIRKSFVLGLFSGVAQAADSEKISVISKCGTTDVYTLKTFPLDDKPCDCGDEECFFVRWITK